MVSRIGVGSAIRGRCDVDLWGGSDRQGDGLVVTDTLANSGVIAIEPRSMMSKSRKYEKKYNNNNNKYSTAQIRTIPSPFSLIYIAFSFFWLKRLANLMTIFFFLLDASLIFFAKHQFPRLTMLYT